MVSSCFHRDSVKGRIVAGRFIVALAVLAGALMLAPEDPGAQASISSADAGPGGTTPRQTTQPPLHWEQGRPGRQSEQNVQPQRVSRG